MSAEENKARFRRMYEEGFNQSNLAVAEELTAPDFINHEAPPGKDRGPESMRQLIPMLRAAFPDLHFTIEDLVAEGDTVAGRLTMSGTHEGSLMGMPPTGRPVRQSHMHFVRFRDGKAIDPGARAGYRPGANRKEIGARVWRREATIERSHTL